MPVPITFKVNLDNSSTTKVAAAQTIGGAGNLTLSASASAIDSSGAARILLFTTTENDSSINATITGLDADGNAISETLALPNNTTGVSTNAYASVSQIAVSGAIASNISVGTTNSTLTAYSRTIPLNFYARIAAMIALEVTGTLNISIQETFDRILANGTANAIWMAAPSGITSQTSSAHAQCDIGVTGIRLKYTSYTNGATATVVINQPSNSNLG